MENDKGKGTKETECPGHAAKGAWCKALSREIKKSHQPGQESNEQPPIYPRLGLTAITCCVNRDAAHYTTETGDGCHAGFIHIKSENGLPAQLRGMGEL